MNTTEQHRPIVPDDLFKIRFMMDAELSPDGKNLVYSVFDSPAGGEDTISLYLYSLETGKTRPLIPGGTIDTTPRWSPDGKSIAFYSLRGGGFPQIYLVSADGGEPFPLTTMEKIIRGGPVWSPDGKYIAITASPALMPPTPGKPYRLTQKVYRMDGAGYVEGYSQNIHIVPVDGGAPIQLTYEEGINANPVWSPDGTRILFSSSKLNSFHDGSDLKVVSLSGEITDILAGWGAASTAAWLPDSSQIAFVGGPGGPEISHKPDIWITDQHGKKPEIRTPGHPGWLTGWLQPDGIVWADKLLNSILEVSEDGQYVYAQSQVGGRSPIVRVALFGPVQIEEVIPEDRTCLLLDIKAGKILYGISAHNEPSELCICNLDGSEQRQLTWINKELIHEWQMPKVEHMPVIGSRGDPVDAWVMLPPQGTPPYPTVLYIHGGPANGFGNIFSFDFLMLASAGYAVLFANPHGSTGYGREFENSILGDWGNLDYLDLMIAIDTLIEKGIADENRLGVCGLSYGGYMSCWMVGHTDRFKAAVPENPVTNLLSLYGTSDIGYPYAAYLFAGRPDEALEKYIRCSPITYAHNCKTPTLLIQAEDDYRDPPEQSEQFYRVLQIAGCKTEMLRIPGCSHYGTISGSQTARQAQNEALLEWMNRYLKA
jgi:dipeptidyl aminopeptidase/acylaminoacyl peptidase